VSPLVPVPRSRQAITLGAAAIALTVVTYLTSPTLFETLDFFRIHDSYRQYFAQAVRMGRLPLWNPHIGLGRPFLADVDATFFYPPGLLYVVLERHIACAVLTAAHLWLGLWGMTALAERLGIERRIGIAVALVFFSGGAVVACFQTGLINYGNAACYLPLALALAIDLQEAPSLRRFGWLALVMALQLLAGHPQMSWLTGVGMATLLVGRRLERPLAANLAAAGRDLARLLAVSALAAGLAAVQVLPLAELIGQSNRQRPSLAFSGSFAIEPWGWITLLLPGGRWLGVPSTSQLYLGTATFLAGACGLLGRDRNRRALLLVALLAALITAGNSTPAFTVLYHLLPGMSAMRIPSRAGILICLALSLAAGLFASRARPSRAVHVGLAVITLLATVVGTAFARWWLARYASAWTAVPRAAVTLAAGGLLLLWIHREHLRGRWTGPAVAAALLALVAFDLTVSTVGIKQQFRDPSYARSEAAVTRALRKLEYPRSDGLLPRVYVPIPEARENAGMQLGYSSFTGYNALTLGRVWEYLHVSLGLPVPLEQNTYPEQTIARRGGPLPYRSMNLVLGFDLTNRRFVVPSQTDPRAYLVTRAEVVPDWHQAIRRMRDGHDFHATALVEREVPPLGPGPAGTARIVAFAPEDIVAQTNGATSALLVLAEAWYPGWTATVDGRPAECLPANGWMRAVPVPPGAHEVRLRYRSRWLRTGGAVSILSLMVLAAVLGRRRPSTTAGGSSGAG
jgi:hypothetical protein